MKISQAFDVYCSDYILFKNLSKKTEEAYRVSCKLLVAYLGDKPIAEITFNDVRDWKTWLDNGRSPSTVRGYIICLRVLLKYCKKLNLDVIDYELIPVPKRVQKIPTFVTPKEVQDFIIEAAKPLAGYSRVNRVRNQALISFLYASGIRASEICQLDRDSIREKSFTIVGKGGKPRLCFIDARTENLLEQYLSLRSDSHPALFISNQNGKRLTTNNLQRIFLSISTRAKLTRPIHPHTLRHTFATNLLKNNCNMRYVQELLGHSSLATTQMYTHVTNSDLESVYTQFHTT